MHKKFFQLVPYFTKSSAFARYLDTQSIGNFRPDELNEVILGTYTILRRSVLDGADELRLTSTHFVWKRWGLSLGTFVISDLRPSLSFRDALKFIIERDTVVRQHLFLTRDTPQALVYRFQRYEQ